MGQESSVMWNTVSMKYGTLVSGQNILIVQVFQYDVQVGIELVIVPRVLKTVRGQNAFTCTMSVVPVTET